MTLAAPAAMEPVRRTFAVLEALNRRRTSTLGELAADTGLPKPTLARAIEGLIALGYAAQVSRSLGYRVTDRTLALAGGVRYVDHLVDAAAGPMIRFTRENGWPLYLGTLAPDGVVIRYSTATDSPMAFETSGYGRRMPPLNSALGRVIMAYHDAPERRRFLRAFGGVGVDPRTGRRLDALHEAAFARIRREGCAFTVTPRPSRLNGLAVPVRDRGRVLAAVSLRFPVSAMGEVEARTRYAAPLTGLAVEIAEAAAKRVGA